MSKTPITDGYEWTSWPGMTMPAECCRDLEKSRDEWRRMCTVLAGQLQSWVDAFEYESNNFELSDDIQAIRQYLALFEREKGKQNTIRRGSASESSGETVGPDHSHEG